MRKTITAVAVGTALILTACADTTEPTATDDQVEQAEAPETTDEADTDTEDTTETDEVETEAAAGVTAPDIAYAQFIDAHADRAGTAPSCDDASAIAEDAAGMSGGEGYAFLVVDGQFAVLAAGPQGGVGVVFGTSDDTQLGGVTDNSREYLDTVWGDTPLVKVTTDGTCTDAGQTVSEFVAANL